MTPQIFTLEGEPKNYNLIEDKENYYLLGSDIRPDKRYKYSKDGSYIQGLEFSYLHGDYIPVNEGTEEIRETITSPNNPGIFFHIGKENNLLGCTFCLTDETLGSDSPEIFITHNLDGSIAGIHLPTETGYLTLDGANELGFFKKGFKMPKVSMPKMSMPKLSMPKLKIPKINIPKISLPKITMPKLPDIGKQLSSITKPIMKGISNAGKQIEKISKESYKAVEKLGQQGFGLVSDVLSTATGLVSNLLPGGQQMQPGQEGQEEQGQEQGLDYTMPGYQDETGYTASDGNYYTHDGQYVLINGQWQSLAQQGNEIMDYTQPGYQDETGYTASDGNFYTYDGHYVLINGQWIDRATLQGFLPELQSELGFDPFTISALLPTATNILSNLMPGHKGTVNSAGNILSILNDAKLRQQPVTVRQAPAPPQAPAMMTARQAPPPPPKPPQQMPQMEMSSRGILTSDKKEFYKDPLVIGGVLGVGALAFILMNNKKRR